ncbi:MAG: TonB-dependent receptor [Bacteroidia bacterium]
MGIIASKLTVEGPIWKDKTSVMLSARRTYLDILAQPIIRAAANGTSAGYYFYDAVGKINHKFNDRNRLFLSFYGGRDKAYARDHYEDQFGNTTYESDFKTKLGWGNQIAAVRWNHLFSDKLFANFTGTYSRFQFGVGFDSKDVETTNGVKRTDRFGFEYESFIKDWTLRTDFDWFASPNHLVRFGGYGIHHNFTPGVTSIVIESPGYSSDTALGAETITAVEMGAYIEDDWKISSRQKLNLGLHASAFDVKGKFYHSVQPRISYRLLLSDNWSAKASFTTMYQYIHLLTNANVGLPTDLWVPATDSITPQSSVQGAVGIARSFKDLGLELSVEGYYKYMTGLLEYKEGASYFAESSDWQNKVVQGRGWSYGSEVFLQKKYGKTTGWIGYTLSWTNRQFDELNNGKVFPFKYDRRHDLSIVLQHKFSEKVDAAITWVYGTGAAVTLPVGSYRGLWPSSYWQDYQPTIDHINDRNSYRMRPYHRLDIGFNFTKQKKHFERTWSVGLYNAYSRRNPFFLYLDNDPITDKRILKQVSLFPIIPSVAYHFKF